MRGWLGYYGIAEMDTLMKQWNEWLRRRIRMYEYSAKVEHPDRFELNSATAKVVH